MKLYLYPDSDALYVEFADSRPYHHSKELDEDRVVHYDEADSPIGVKFLGISEGVSLRDVPQGEAIARVLENYKQVPIYA